MSKGKNTEDFLVQLREWIRLLELLEANPFKIRAIQGLLFQLEREPIELALTNTAELTAKGFSKSSIDKIEEWKTQDILPELQECLNQIPSGVLQIMRIKGLGPKKVRQLWKEHQIESIGALKEACLQNYIASFKGFGAKTQENILQELALLDERQGKWLFAELDQLGNELEARLQHLLHPAAILPIGDYAQKEAVIEEIGFLIGIAKPWEIRSRLTDLMTIDPTHSGLFVYHGLLNNRDVPLTLRFCAPERFGNEAIRNRSSAAHLKHFGPSGQSLAILIKSQNSTSEEALYGEAQLPFIPAEARHGDREWNSEFPPDSWITFQDLQGALHNHSTWSDGKNSIEEMVQACQSRGLTYFGIADHSQTAAYAGGLRPEQVIAQHKEINDLQSRYPNFGIFKGIESDILMDGSLDYEAAVLATFDYVVASVHSSLTMKMDKAHERLIAAIENPFTTILGHATGRLLLKREGYPIDHRYILDACAANQVVVELNANPYRLDVDWRHLGYALDKGCVISINPDAHNTAGLDDMQYGVWMARKACLPKESILNAWPIEKVRTFFESQKSKRK